MGTSLLCKINSLHYKECICDHSFQDSNGKEVEINLAERPSIVADTWEISPDNIMLGKELGSGFFGEVYRCTIQGPISTPYTERNQLSKWIALPAAVKILKGNFFYQCNDIINKQMLLLRRCDQISLRRLS